MWKGGSGQRVMPPDPLDPLDPGDPGDPGMSSKIDGYQCGGGAQAQYLSMPCQPWGGGLRGGLYIDKLPINRPSGRYVKTTP